MKLLLPLRRISSRLFTILTTTLLGLTACQRVYEPLPKGDRPITPEAGERLHMDQGEIERRATGYIRQLSFDLARQELELPPRSTGSGRDLR